MSDDRPPISPAAARRAFDLLARAAHLSAQAHRLRAQAFELRGYDPSMTEAATRFARSYESESAALRECSETYLTEAPTPC